MICETCKGKGWVSPDLSGILCDDCYKCGGSGEIPSPPPEPVENRDRSVSQSGVSGRESGGEGMMDCLHEQASTIAILREQVDALQEELEEQARIVGMGAERELRLIAERGAAREELAEEKRLRQVYEETAEKFGEEIVTAREELKAKELGAARYREALEKIGGQAPAGVRTHECPLIAREALAAGRRILEGK